MSIYSTNKMLAKMMEKNAFSEAKIEKTTLDIEEILSAPQLSPTADMEQILSNILGASASKKCSPMDK